MTIIDPVQQLIDNNAVSLRAKIGLLQREVARQTQLAEHWERRHDILVTELHQLQDDHEPFLPEHVVRAQASADQAWASLTESWALVPEEKRRETLRMFADNPEGIRYLPMVDLVSVGQLCALGLSQIEIYLQSEAE